MTHLAVGIIGAGASADLLHIPGYAAQPNAEVVGIASRTRAAAEKVARKYGIRRVYDSPAELLRDESIDAVSICTPPSSHAELLEAACATGKHVLIEKPIATTLEDLDHMRRLAQASPATVEIVHNERFMEFNVRAKAVVAGGDLGALQLIHQFVSTTGPEAWTESGAWFRQPEVSGGGVLIDLAVHKLDVATWLLEDDVPRMTCAQYEGPVEDVAAIHGATVHGVMISVSSSWRGPADESTLLVVGTNGFLFGCGSAGTLAVRVGQETRTHDVVAPWSERDRSPEPMIADFVAACQEGRRPIATDPLWDVATRRVLEVYEGE